MLTVPDRYLSRLAVRRRTPTRRRIGLRRWMHWAATVLTPLAAAQLAMALDAGVARAAPVAGPLGVDVSQPQCGRPLPTGQAFALVGVNGGTARTTNPCLASQLAWARRSTGATVHDDVQLYVNTGNPGGPDAASWPRSGSNRYGKCHGSDSTSCAYQYGWDRARDDAMNRGISRPEGYMWWLDVEIANTWDYTDGGPARNVAVLEGMTEYFTSIGVRGVGLYSTRYQWTQIVGDAVGSTSSLNGLSNWRPAGSGSTLEDARANCGLAPLTPGGRVELTQFTSDYDYNHSCI
jgi:hypothetical protein